MQRWEKKAFLNLWSMASSVLTVNWVLLGEWSESGSAEVTARNDNTRSDWHLHPHKTSSTVGQVFPIFLLFLPASFQMVCWDEHSCWQISVSSYHPTSPGGEDAHQCYEYVLPNPAEESLFGRNSLLLDIYASLLRARVWQKLWYLKALHQSSNKHSLMQQSAWLTWSLSSQAL